MNVSWSRSISLVLSLIIAILAYHHAPRRRQWLRILRLALALGSIGGAIAVSNRRPSWRPPWLRIANQVFAIAYMVLVHRYPARRSMFRRVAFVTSIISGFLEWRMVRQRKL